METKYIAASKAAKEVVWLKNFLNDLEVIPNIDKPITLHCDNSGAVINSKELWSHKRGKYIERKYHLIWDIISRGDMIVITILTLDNLADPLTKTLSENQCFKQVEEMGLKEMSYLL